MSLAYVSAMIITYILYSLMPTEMMLGHVTKGKLQRITEMMWQRWSRDDGQLKTFISRSRHNHHPQRRNDEDWLFALQLPLAVGHLRYFHLQICCLAVNDGFGLPPSQTLRLKSKLSWGYEGLRAVFWFRDGRIPPGPLVMSIGGLIDSENQF